MSAVTVGDTVRSDQNEAGIILVLAAMLVTGFIGIVVFVVYYGYMYSVQAELQSASDAAALAAVTRLNSSKNGWKDAREAAVETISRHSALSSIGRDQSMELSHDNDDVEKHIWDLTSEKNLRVTIDRGRWTPAGGTEPEKFVSFEDDWQTNNPGTPVFVAANAVRVTIERPQTSAIGTPFGVFNTDVPAVSIGLKAPVDSVCVAPFAIPVCSLINHQGQYMGEDTCHGDRIFAQLDRYCDPDVMPASCLDDVVPSTPYTPANSTYPAYSLSSYNGFNDICGTLDLGGYTANGVRYPNNLDTHIGDTATYRDLLPMPQPDWPADEPVNIANHASVFRSGCTAVGWIRQQRFSAVADVIGGAPSDHYGVVGYPGNYENDSEDDLQQRVLDLLSTGNTCVNTRIGDRFTVLQNGLTDIQADNLIWNLINNNGQAGVTDAAHIPISQSLVGPMAHHIDAFTWVDTHDLVTNQRHQPLCATTFSNRGVCNSHRGQYELVEPWKPGSNPFDSRAVYGFKLFPGITDASTVWRIRVPVIGEEGTNSAGCGNLPIRNRATPQRDPVVEKNRTYKVIGFVDMIVYDVDIGKPSPRYLVQSPYGNVTEPFPEVMRFQQACNNVRARISCESQFIPTSQAAGYPAPRLVNQPS